MFSKNEKFIDLIVSRDSDEDKASMNNSQTAPVSFKSFKSKLSMHFDYVRNSQNHESNLGSCIQLSLRFICLKF